MRPERLSDSTRDHLTFGGRLPWGVGLLLVLTVVPSVVAALGSRHVAPIFELAALDPSAVWRGQVWRLATYALVEPGPIGLVFTCLAYAWFGKDLAADWGSGWFLRVFGSVAVGAGVLTCLVALVDPSVAGHRYLGALPISGAVFVAWGLTFPYRRVLFFWFFPIRGWWAAWGTVALTALYAAYGGWAGVLPELLAELGIAAYLMRGDTLARFVEQLRGVWSEQKRRASRAKAASHLKVVEEVDDELDDLSGDEDLKRRIDEAVRKGAEGPKKPPRDLN